MLFAGSFLIIRDGFPGLDSYYFYSGDCNANDNHYQGDAHPLANGWLAMLFIGLTPLFLNLSFRLENDALAFPFMFISLYYFLKHINQPDLGWCVVKKQYHFLLISLLMLAVASILWGGSLYYLLVYALYTPIALIILVPIILFFGGNFINPLIATSLIGENYPFLGIVFVFFYFLIWKKYTHPFNKITWGLIILGIFNAKFLILALPLLALTIVKAYEEHKPETKKAIILVAIMANLAFPMMIAPTILNEGSRPTQIELLAVQETIQYANQNNLNIENDWELGHIVFYYGGSTPHHTFYAPKSTKFSGDNTVVLTQWDLNCSLVKTFVKPESLIKLESNLNLYKC